MQQRKLKDLELDRPASSSLQTYCLKYADDGFGIHKCIQFEAIDAWKALNIAQKEAPNRRAELWCDGRKLCNICRTEVGIWEIRR